MPIDGRVDRRGGLPRRRHRLCAGRVPGHDRVGPGPRRTEGGRAMSALLASAAIAIGMALVAIACYGVLVLPDALSRQHAATKAATLALAVLAIGVGALLGTAEVWTKLGVLLVTLAATMPLASHALARAAHGPDPEDSERPRAR
ncbi:MAG: hypothetical protein GC161_11190 [Planctomycetaceae bacterium]|nr:hypothetical protein [Planctomycetaceae bacterium]